MAAEFTAGSQVGRFILEEKRGAGSFGEVWRARDSVTEDVVAVKLLTGLLAGTDSARLRAEVELLAAAAASRSPHVVRVIEGDVHPVPYIAMEFVEGKSLAEILKRRGTLPADDTVRIGLGIADALSMLGSAGIVHRDVKPANVMLDNEGTVKLADFGIAKIIGYETMTMTGQVLLAMAYAAPEVWSGNASHRSDLYAMGTLLYQCLAGAPPFTGSAETLLYLHTNAVPDLDALPAETPKALRELIRQCLEKDPATRPRDARACIDLLERAEAELAPVHEPTHFGPWICRGPHKTRAWAWYCEHKETGEAAVVEVHASDDLDYRKQLEKAVKENHALVPLGAERLLGTSRLLLGPREAWRDPPAGQFQFWVARQEVTPPPSPERVSRALLLQGAENLLKLLDEAHALGLQL